MNAGHAFVLLLTFATGLLAAEPTPLKADPVWQGSAKDETKEESIPKIVTDKAKFTEVWKGCERFDEVPDVDFAKNIVFVVTSRGSHISLRQALLSDAGDLKALAIETRDFRPGFRYLIAVFPREGVKSVNGVKLPK